MTSWVNRLAWLEHISCGCSEVDDVGRFLDSADTFSADLGYSHVAGLTPGSSPGVSHDPVALVAVASVADNTDGVIERGTTSGVVEDTGSVSGEDASVGLDEDRDGLLGDSGLHGADAVGRDHSVGGSPYTSSSSVVSARAILGRVGVRVLSHEVVLGSVVEGLLLPSTIASVVGGVAINKLLLGEGQESAGLDEVASFKGSSGGERPARTALSLILDTVDGTLRSPVDRSGGRTGARAGRRSIALMAGHLAVGEHVAGVSLALTARGPRGAVCVVVLAGGEVSSLGLLLADSLVVIVSDSSSEHLSVFVVREV